MVLRETFQKAIKKNLQSVVIRQKKLEARVQEIFTPLAPLANLCENNLISSDLILMAEIERRSNNRVVQIEASRDVPASFGNFERRRFPIKFSESTSAHFLCSAHSRTGRKFPS